MRCSWIALLCLAGCLPESDQPVPGSARVTVTSDAALTEGFETADGWRIEYDQALVAIGFVRLWSDLERDDGVRCHAAHEYSTEYTRVIDARRAGAQLIATPHGLGPCELGLQLWGGADTVVLGEGVEEREADRLIAPGGDPFVPRGPTSLAIAGRATRDGVEKRFEWSIRHAFDFERCVSLVLERGTQRAVGFELDGTALFRAQDDAEPSFDALAALDADDDGSITLEELAADPIGEELYVRRSAAILVPPDLACQAREIGP